MIDPDLEGFLSSETPSGCGYCANESAAAEVEKVLRAVVDRRVKKSLSEVYRYTNKRAPSHRSEVVFRRHVKNCLPDLYKSWQAT